MCFDIRALLQPLATMELPESDKSLRLRACSRLAKLLMFEYEALNRVNANISSVVIGEV